MILRVVHINLYDIHGGAARISWTLMEYMTRQGHDVNIFAHHKASQDSRVVSIPPVQTRWQKKLLAQQTQQGLFDLYSVALWGVIGHPLFEQADIIHLHCINGGYFSFFLLPFLTAKPTIWTLHDPLAFTAGCLYTDFCNGWKENGCADCPQDAGIGSTPQRELIQRIKEDIYKVAKFTAVCPSVWLENQAKQSILQEHDTRLIYNGVDIDRFKPGHRLELRTKLGLPTDKKMIMFAAHGGFNSGLKGGKLLCEALVTLHKDYPDVVLLNIGTVDNSMLRGLLIQRIDIPFITDSQLLSEYYAAADIFVSPSLVENLSLAVCEASACGTPVVAFAVGGTPEIIIHKETGYLAKGGDSEDLALGIAYFLDNEHLRQQAGDGARKRVVEKFSASRMVEEYLSLYEEILQEQTGWGNIPRLVETAKNSSWDKVWQEFHNLYNQINHEQPREREIFTDEFLNYCLGVMALPRESDVLWKIIELWQKYRKVPEHCGGLSPEELAPLMEFCLNLREKLYEYFTVVPHSELLNLTEERQDRLCRLWQQVFLNDSLPLLSQGDKEFTYQDVSDSVLDKDIINQYFKLLRVSMYHPLTDGSINAIQLWNHQSLPGYCKVIITMWMLSTPYYGIGEKHRGKIVKYIPELCKANIPICFFIKIINELVKAMWRISYVGGNNLPALISLGEFSSSYMQRIFSQYAHQPLIRVRTKEDKLRIGYVSRFFYSQAVSYYMVNRVIHHDRDKYEVYVFALGNRYDHITEKFSDNAEHFVQFKSIEEPDSMYKIAKSIVDSQLDVLIYTDIGMDPLTYMLAGLRLAPVQCAMVGHGTTSGLATMDYYLSGDFEPANGEKYYIEKLIRLPHLGAAQYPPPFADDIPITRKDWKIPEEAVVFVSCANGIKHGIDRDAVLVEILKREPNACILVKPCHTGNNDRQIGERIMAVAKQAGVDKRLLIVPPLGRVDALLAIADIQLDTYPYGGWTTNMEALYMGLPIITQEGDMARSRWGAHMLRVLGIEEGIAANADEYVEWAVCLAQDRELRLAIKTRIKSQAIDVLFNGAKAQAAYEQQLEKIIWEGRV